MASSSSVILVAVSFQVLLALVTAQTECDQFGGWCGDPVFDECDEGDWDYSVDCDPYYYVCCVPSTPPTTTTTTAPPSSSTTTPPDGNSTGTPPSGCGVRPDVETPTQQIVGGYESVPYSWPWSIAMEIDYFEWGDWQHHCGGSLIAPQWVLTAGHCVAKSGLDDPQFFRVILGMHYQRPAEQDGQEIYMGVESYHVHPDYDTEVDGSPNDLSLLKLLTPVTYTDRVSPACLPTHFSQNFTDQDTCFITGWGETKDTGPEFVLNESPINVITNALCDTKWEEGSGRVGLIKESHICAGNGLPAGTCNGDSGGPLSCQQGGAWYLAGATSFGASGCVSMDAPDVYTRISHFLDWIQNTMDTN